MRRDIRLGGLGVLGTLPGRQYLKMCLNRNAEQRTFVINCCLMLSVCSE